MVKLSEHIQYIHRRKEELKDTEHWRLVNDLIIKELELMELENQVNGYRRI